MRLSMKVWDAPTRLFHWALVLLVATSWYTDRIDRTDLHFLSGYAILTLLVFRLVWGVIGSDTARFSHFIRSPIEGLRHLAHFTRREPDEQIGHNAAGGWMVLLMLTLLLVQVITGLCSHADFDKAPFAEAVGEGLSDFATHVHHLNFTLIEILIVVHVLVILAYAAIKRHDLVRPMLTGKKRLPANLRAPRLSNPLLALAVLVVCGLAVWGLVSLGSS